MNFSINSLNTYLFGLSYRVPSAYTSSSIGQEGDLKSRAVEIITSRQDTAPSEEDLAAVLSTFSDKTFSLYESFHSFQFPEEDLPSHYRTASVSDPDKIRAQAALDATPTNYLVDIDRLATAQTHRSRSLLSEEITDLAEGTYTFTLTVGETSHSLNVNINKTGLDPDTHKDVLKKLGRRISQADDSLEAFVVESPRKVYSTLSDNLTEKVVSLTVRNKNTGDSTYFSLEDDSGTIIDTLGSFRAYRGAIGSSVRSDTAELHFLRSAFGSETFESGEVKVIVNVHDSTNTVLHLTSTVADLDVTGNFTFASLINSWQHSVQMVGDVVKYRIQNLDSLRSFTGHEHKLQEFHSSHIANFSPIDAQFRININNLKPFGVFLQIPLKGNGLIEGGIIGDVTDLQFNGTLNLEQVGLRLGTDTLGADAVSIKYFLGGVNSQTALHTLNTSIETDLQNSKFNDLLLNQASAQFVLESDSSDFQFSALVDSTVRIDLEGISRQNGNLLELELPEMRVEVGQYIAENVDTVRLTLGRDGFRIQSFIMNHDAEEMSLEGFFSPIGVSDLNISLQGFLLTNLKQILHRGAYAKSSTQFGGIVNMTAFYRGSLDHPNINIDLLADGVRADDSLQNKHKVLGRIESRISYFEHMLSLLVKFLSRPEDKSTKPDLLLSGTLPFEFVLVYEKPHKLEGEVNLTMQSTGLSLEFLNPFIPEFHNLTGMMICDMQMKGPLDAPRYEGSMSILNSNFVFDPLGIRYSLNGDLITTGDKICLKDLIICNVPSERKVGTMKVSGNFSMSGLTLKEFDLLSHGDLFVMREDTSRARGQKVYGNLFIATGPDGLSWQGNLSASTVRGNIFIKDAQLILPPESESELIRASAVNMSFIDDTSKQVKIKSELNNRSEKTLLSQIGNNTLSTEASSGITSELPQNSFLDRINYDIGIETQGSTQLRFVFNTQTSEELFADLQGRLYFNRTPNISRLTGQVEVSGQSYYNFIKKFEATGKLSFTGNVLNPELEVTAKYEGPHLYSY